MSLISSALRSGGRSLLETPPAEELFQGSNPLITSPRCSLLKEAAACGLDPLRAAAGRGVECSQMSCLPKSVGKNLLMFSLCVGNQCCVHHPDHRFCHFLFVLIGLIYLNMEF